MAEEKTVLVTGGSGYLGSWCIVALLEQGYRVRTTVRDLAREAEVRAAVGSQVSGDERLTVLAADLTEDAGWQEAVAGCDYVLHVASPFPPKQPKDPDELIVPAREGTLRVLRAALDAGVERVVVTSSVAAVAGGSKPGRELTEEDWTDPDIPGSPPTCAPRRSPSGPPGTSPASKTPRERLAVVNPGAILGPVLSDDQSFSLQMVERLLEGTPGIPRIGFSVVDVRDVADLHLRAMTTPEAGGERFIAAGPFLWAAEVAAILREHFGAAAPKVPKRSLPDFVVRLASRFDSDIRSFVGQLGVRYEYSSEKAETRLGWQQRPAEQMIVECAESMLARAPSN